MSVSKSSWWGIPPDFRIIDEQTNYAAGINSWGVPAYFEEIWDGPTGRQGVTGRGVVIANLDSGVMSRHRLLQQPNKIIARRTFVGGDIEDDNGHGTMTSTNSSGIRDNGDRIGVAPDSQLIVGKVFTSRGSGPSIDDSIIWAVKEGAHIINYSGGGPSYWRGTEDAVNYAQSKGVVVFCSSGNSGPNTRGYPAYLKNTISVGAIQENGRLASFSTTNMQVDVAAPGQSVTVGNRSGGVSRANGTSFSCPWMSGMAALVLQDHWRHGHPGISNVDVWRKFIDESSSSDVDPHRDYTYGVPNALMMARTLYKQLKLR